MKSIPVLPRIAIAVVFAGVAAAPAAAQAVNSLSPEQAQRVTAAIRQVIDATHVPSASVGIVQHGKIVYVQAFGDARLSPRVPANPAMRYAIGSISKQFTTAAVLLLAQEGKLSLDDPVARWFPELTRAKDVKLRNLLSHTSGYEDYAPQDYTIPAWTHPTSAQKIVHEWATKPLDFEPGTQYQYSNTNFNIVGLIVEKASGEPFWDFLSSRVLKPLGLTRTLNLDTQHAEMEPVGYMRNALGPLRPAISEAPGWYFADGEMAMPVSELLTWDISMMNQTLLAPASYKAMETEFTLKNGKGAGYGLGVGVGTTAGHRVISHGGEVGGFVASNTVFPDDKFAVAVLTNQEASSAAGSIGRAIANLLVLAPTAAADAATAEARAKRVLSELQQGKIDRSQFTANANFYFNATAIADYQSSLSRLGAITSVRQTSSSLRGGMTYRGFEVTFAGGKKVALSTYETGDGKLEQFLVEETV